MLKQFKKMFDIIISAFILLIIIDYIVVFFSFVIVFFITLATVYKDGFVHLDRMIDLFVILFIIMILLLYCYAFKDEMKKKVTNKNKKHGYKK